MKAKNLAKGLKRNLKAIEYQLESCDCMAHLKILLDDLQDVVMEYGSFFTEKDIDFFKKQRKF